MPFPSSGFHPSPILRKLLRRKALRRIKPIKAPVPTDEPHDTVVYPECVLCGSVFTTPVNLARYQQQQAGELPAQDAYPRLHPRDRELFISGLCRRCFAASVLPPKRRLRALRRIMSRLAQPHQRLRRK